MTSKEKKKPRPEWTTKCKTQNVDFGKTDVRKQEVQWRLYFRNKT